MHDLGYRHVVEGEPGGSEAWKTLASAAARHEEIPVGHGEMRAALSQEISAEVDGGQITEGQGKGGVVVSERSGKAPMVALNLVDPDRVTDTGRAIQPVGSRSGDEHGPAPAGVSLGLLVNEEVELDRVGEWPLTSRSQPGVRATPRSRRRKCAVDVPDAGREPHSVAGSSAGRDLDQNHALHIVRLAAEMPIPSAPQ